MKKTEFEIGDTVYYSNSSELIGKVVGVRETYWSGDNHSSVVYIVSTPAGKLKRVCSDEVGRSEKG